MAETATGAINLLGLFSTVIDCFEYVRIAKTFERDPATAQLRLDSAAFRLSRWGEAIGIQNRSTDSALEDRYERAEMILQHLELLWAQARQKSKIFERPGVEMYEVEDMEPVQAVVHKGIKDKIWHRIHPEPESRVRRRRESEPVSRVEKAKWALYKETELNELVNSIGELVGQLELVLPSHGGLVSLPENQVEEIPEPARRMLQELAEKDVAEMQEIAQQQEQSPITPLQVVETLHEAAKGQDPYLEEAINKIVKELRPNAQADRMTYKITCTMSGVTKNSGMVSVVYNGNQYNY